MLLKKLDGYFLPITIIGSNYGLIAVKWGSYICIGVYQSPNRPLVEFESKLKWIGEIIRKYKEHPIVITGDLNSRHKRWDLGKTNQRGVVLENGLVKFNLQILHPRYVTTCVHAPALMVSIVC